ncbi:hypothetical protein BUALT_Bualt03G0033300 [Buddleja alternifolia]|uniref:FCP1 homology domain-containing protein n=1 Tax=Buddleja alternifolia TaxID=168488 RepID=A0AAV6XXJ6_9LAMI|nr:hypothetical protein BUALT_Bualt03G0033300 [Buddleja alternifolia]
MPSLKMKTKSTGDCLKEKNGLHVCRKSSMISKNPLSRTRVSENAEEIGDDTQISEDASVYNGQNLGEDANHDELSNGEKLFPKQAPSIADSAIVDSMHLSDESMYKQVLPITSLATLEPTLSTCTSDMETMFSPILESIDFQNIEGSDNLYVPQLDSEESDDSSRSSREYKACNELDFYISDMIFSAPSIESNSVIDNKTDTFILPDYKCEESSVLCATTEDFMAFPFLEDTLNTGRNDDDRPPEDHITNADNSSLYMAIHQLRSYNQDSHINTYPEPDYECFDPQMYISNHPDQADMAFDLLPTSFYGKQNTKQITLVLDLDETLVHSTVDYCDDADFTFTVFFNMKEHIVYVKERPHLHTFLKRVAEMFEIVVFTASQSLYAKQLLDILDPDGKLISRRAYRESCIFSEGTYVKDLTILGVDLAKVAIIDNSPQVFRLQVNNGIPIKSWFDDPSDSALISLLPFLETLVDADDVRPFIARKFGNKE